MPEPLKMGTNENCIVCYFAKDSVQTAVELAKYAGLHAAVVRTSLPPAYEGGRPDPRTLDDHLILFSKVPVDVPTVVATFHAQKIPVHAKDIEIHV